MWATDLAVNLEQQLLAHAADVARSRVLGKQADTATLGRLKPLDTTHELAKTLQASETTSPSSKLE